MYRRPTRTRKWAARYNNEYLKWRCQVLKRDKRKCKWPHCTCRKRLQVHHIVRWADNFSLRYNVGNGITLCQTHHKFITKNETIYAKLLLGLIKDS